MPFPLGLGQKAIEFCRSHRRAVALGLGERQQRCGSLAFCAKIGDLLLGIGYPRGRLFGGVTRRLRLAIVSAASDRNCCASAQCRATSDRNCSAPTLRFISRPLAVIGLRAQRSVQEWNATVAA